jgi:protein involved in polysaccharide export with SLBB domain
MERRQGRLTGGWLLGALLALAGGCATARPELARDLLADRDPPGHRADVASYYTVHCPDVLTIDVAGPAPWHDNAPVTIDGRIVLPRGLPLRVEGLTPPEIARAVARRLEVPPGLVNVSLAEYRSQQIYIYGEVNGRPRGVPYQGPETVVELLQRAGGIAPGAAADDIQVVRSHVADGTPPEVFQVDLDAILRKQDGATNVYLQPFDQVHVGQSRHSRLRPCFPCWFRPLYDALGGVESTDRTVDHTPGK